MDNNTSANTSTAESIISTKKLKVVLTAYKQTSYADYTHIFKTVEIEIPKILNAILQLSCLQQCYCR